MEEQVKVWIIYLLQIAIILLLYIMKYMQGASDRILNEAVEHQVVYYNISGI